jgi:hypothetical protein
MSCRGRGRRKRWSLAAELSVGRTRTAGTSHDDWLASRRHVSGLGEGRPQAAPRGDADVIVRRTGRFPWFLRALESIFVLRWLVEFNSPASILSLAREPDGHYGIGIYSFSRALLPALVSHLQSRGSDVAEIADRDPTYAELILDGDSPGEEEWLVSVRWYRDCPSDLVECLNGIDDLE